MSVPFGPFALTLDDLTQPIRRTVEPFTDLRQGKDTRSTRGNAGLSAFTVLFMQYPSCVESQRRLEPTLGRHNAQPLFGVHHLPADKQIRPRLDSPAHRIR